MDNITHTLVGLAAAELICVADREKKLVEAAPTLWVASAIANNIPDSDFLLARALTGGPIGYLLHHRGYTHTLIAALPQALLVFALIYFIQRLRKKDFQKKIWMPLAALCLLGPCLHVFLDWLNSYGVHPFWPWNSRWYYGDAVFIIEPWVWVLLIPPLLFTARSKLAKAALLLSLLFITGLVLFSGYVPWFLAILLALAALWLCGLMYKISRSARIYTAIGAFTAFIIASLLLSSIVKEKAAAMLATQFPAEKTFDIAVSPYPANPLCWSVMTAQLANGEYRVKKGTLALFPRQFGAGECPEFRESDGGTTAIFRPVLAPARPELLWIGEYTYSAAKFSALAKSDCTLSALLQFSRFPGISEPTGESVIAGDLRFDRNKARDFTEFQLGAQTCPKNLPPWVPPRSDLFDL